MLDTQTKQLVDERLERIAVIRQEIDDRHVMLAELLGLTVEPATPKPVEREPFSKAQLFPTKKNKAGPQTTKGCVECGSVSKHKAGCSRPARPEVEKSANKVERKKRAQCPECFSGSIHKAGCSRPKWQSGPAEKEHGNDAWKKLDEERAPRPRGGVLSVEKFERVKIADAHSIPHDTIAEQLGTNEKEVKRAVLSKTYSEYCA